MRGGTRAARPAAAAGLLMTTALLVSFTAASPVLLRATPRPAPGCRMNVGERRWVQNALWAWDRVRERALRLPEADPPRLIVYDRGCVYTLTPEPPGARISGADRVRFGGVTLVSEGEEHGGVLHLPNGQIIAARPETFASLLPGDTATFLLVALEDVWRADPSQGRLDEDWGDYLTRAFVHEMTHSRQLVTLAPRLRIEGGRVGLVDVGDDIIQQRFDSVPGFRERVLHETDLLYRAASARGEERERLARQAVAAILARRAAAYGSTDAAWANIEQLLLDMEGAAQWAAFAHLRHASPRLTTRRRLDLMRGARVFWSQDEGLALYLTLDALVPDWPRHVFGAEPESALELLISALARGNS